MVINMLTCVGMLTARSLLVKTISKVANNSSSASVYTALQLRSSRQYSTNNSKSTHKFSNNKSTTQFLLNNYDNKYSKILSALYATQTTSKPSAPRTARRARAVVENVDVYTGRMRDAWKANVVTAIPFTFREMTAAGIEPNTETFEFLVLALIRLKRYEDAEIAYQSMQERKVEPSRDILFHMMKMYLILKDETRAMNMVSLIKERQFGIDIPMINALLTYYYTTKQSQGIAQTLEMMKAENVQPNQITLNLLMLIHNQQNNNEELQRVYQQFEQLGLYPDDVTLNVLAESRAKTGDVKGTYEIIDKLQAMNKKTSQRVYDALIKHYLKTDQKTKADELLYEVFVRKSQPTIETYRGYVDYYYSRDMTAHLLELMVDFQRNKIRADNDIYKKLVLAAARTNNLSAARDFFAQILDNGARPDNETWYTILEGIGNEGTIEEAIVFSGFMKQLNVPVTPALFNAFVKLYCRHGQPLAALNIAQMFPEHEPKLSNDNLDLILSTIMADMQPFGEKVESVDLNNVTEMYNRIESITGPAPTVARVLAVWEYIKGEGIMADGRVYAHLIAAHGYERNADRVLSLLQEVIEHGITINAESALSMLKGIEHLQRGAEQVLDTLFKHLSEKDTAALSQEVLTKLIELYSNINRLDKAKHCWGMFAVLGKAPYRAAYQAMLDAYIASGSSGLHGSIMLAKQMTEEQSLKHTYPFNVQFFTDFFGYLAIHGAVEYLGTAMGWFKELSAYQKNNKYVTGEHGVLLVSYMRDLAVERAVPKELIDRNMNDLQEAYLNKSSVYRQLRDQLFDPVLTEFDKKLRDVPLQMDEAMRDLMYSISEEMKQPLEKLERNVTNPDVSESELLEDRFLQANAHQLLLGEERVRIRYNGENMEDMDEDMLAEEDVDEDVEDEEDEMDEDEVDEVDDSVDVAEERAKLEKIEQILKNLSGKK